MLLLARGLAHLDLAALSAVCGCSNRLALTRPLLLGIANANDSNADSPTTLALRFLATSSLSSSSSTTKPESSHSAASSSSTAAALGTPPTLAPPQHLNTTSTTTTPAPSTPSSSSSILHKYVSAELVSDVSSTINRLTGYEGIHRLKNKVSAVDGALTAAKRQLQAAKVEYDEQLMQQSQLHREVTALLQRKSSWVPADVSRFTELYAAEHETDKAVGEAKARYAALSDDVELLQLQLVDLIRERYQQEQAWSDKIRAASTWWTWGLMGLHFASFMAVYAIFEPRKRQALTAAVSGMLQQHTAAIDGKLSALAVAPAVADGSTSQQQRERRQQDAAAAATNQQQQQLQSSLEIQQRVLQELERVQQQLQQLQPQPNQHPNASTSSHTPADSQQQQQGPAAQRGGSSWGGGYLQLPSRQWVSQAVSAAGSAAASGWQAAKVRGQELATQLNPLQALAGGGGSRSPAPAAAHSDSNSSSSSGRTREEEKDDGSPAAARPQPAQQQSLQQPAAAAPTREQQQLKEAAGSRQPARGAAAAAGAGAQASVDIPRSQEQLGVAGVALSLVDKAGGAHKSRNSMADVLRQLWLSSSSSSSVVVEVTRSQLVLLGAATSTCGAAVGALVVLLLRGAGAGGTGSSR